MRRISEEESAKISGAIGELGLTISESALEKDFHVSAALAALAKIEHPIFEFVFCGGTCLSKSYGILQRLSEDIDIKVVKKPGTPAISKSALKTELSKLKVTVRDALIWEGFDREQFNEGKEDDEKNEATIRARDENKYIVFNIRYEERFVLAPGLRQRLQIELNYANLVLPAKSLHAVSLIDKLTGVTQPTSTELKTVDLKEAAAEKLLSFPRRLAMHMRSIKANPVDGKRRHLLDPTLVRHVYDIHEISRVRPDVFSDLTLISELMGRAMQTDALDFASQHPEFVSHPVKELRLALQEAKSNPDIENQYDKFVAAMVYGEEKPNFQSALSTFEKYFDEACKPHEQVTFSYLITEDTEAPIEGLAPSI